MSEFFQVVILKRIPTTAAMPTKDTEGSFFSLGRFMATNITPNRAMEGQWRVRLPSQVKRDTAHTAKAAAAMSPTEAGRRA